ncbi:hypothetical protein J437_LFUL005610, partial [Ladona fulva]
MEDVGPSKKKTGFDYSRLGPRKNNPNNCSLELKKVPRGLNNIAHLNNHFAKFGKIVNIQHMRDSKKEPLSGAGTPTQDSNHGDVDMRLTTTSQSIQSVVSAAPPPPGVVPTGVASVVPVVTPSQAGVPPGTAGSAVPGVPTPQQAASVPSLAVDGGGSTAYIPKRRCRDFDEKGYCMRGDLCPYDHGNDPVVLEDVSLSRVLAFGGAAGTRVPPQHPPPLPPNTPPHPPPPPPPPPPVVVGASLSHPPPPQVVGGPHHPRGMMGPHVGGRPHLHHHQSHHAMGGLSHPRGNMEYNPDAPSMEPRMNWGRIQFRGPPPGMRGGMRHTVPRQVGYGGGGGGLSGGVGGGQQQQQHAPQRELISVPVSYEGDPEAALITFSSHAEANAAYRSTEAVLNNRFIKVFWHNKKINEQELVEKQLAQQKILIEKLEKNNAAVAMGGSAANGTNAVGLLKPGEREAIMATVKSLQESIEAIRKDLAAGGPSIITNNAQSHNRKTKEEAQKEILDAELDLFTKQQVGGDTSELQRKVAELKMEAHSLGILSGASAHPTVGVGLRRGASGLMRLRGRGSLRSRVAVSRGGFRGRGRGHHSHLVLGGQHHLHHAHTSVDHRPTKILVSGYEADDKQDVLAHFAQFGELVDYASDESTPSLVIKYRTRKEAEVALLQGRVFQDRLLSLTWWSEGGGSTGEGNGTEVSPRGQGMGDVGRDVADGEEGEEEEESAEVEEEEDVIMSGNNLTKTVYIPTALKKPQPEVAAAAPVAQENVKAQAAAAIKKSQEILAAKEALKKKQEEK